MAKETILVTGGKGMVGSQVPFGIKLSHSELDILNQEMICEAFERHKPSVVLHLAAMTNMLACENNPEQAYEVNVVGTYNVARACREKNIKLVYLSTCAVFDGKKKTPYKESDQPMPVNVYGRTKWLGEIVAKDLIQNALIVRTGWLFGGGLEADKKFVKLSFQKFQKGSEVRATADRHGSPTYIADLLQVIQQLIGKNASGTIHVVNSQMASYFEVAKAIRKLGKFSSPVIAVKASKVEPAGLKRGNTEALVSAKFKLRPWQKALGQYVDSLKLG